MKSSRKSRTLGGTSLHLPKVGRDTNVCDREAVGQRCDVTNWDSQLALFELGIAVFGVIDVVVWFSYSEPRASPFMVP